MKVYHNSWEETYKSVFGALPTDKRCMIRIMAEPEEGIQYVHLHLLNILDGSKNIGDMKRDPKRDDYYFLELCFEKVGIYYYYFTIQTKEGHYHVTHCQDNNATITKEYQDGKWQITVYDKSVKMKELFEEIDVMYQIFPDRFCNSGESKIGVPKDRIVHASITEEPVLLPDEDGVIKNIDFYGGDFKGIISKIPYFKSLGVGMIYLNPIFESVSYHHYDLISYYKVDPSLGTMEEFEELCQVAENNGISIVLDMVFNHTGSQCELYRDATTNPNSTYKDFYAISNGIPEGWWGDPNLFKLNQNNPKVLEYICDVLKFWKKRGVKAVRVDVADELNNETLKRIHEVMDVIPEVWEDLTIKENHEGRRYYALKGDQIDSVMNYPFREAILAYIRDNDSRNFYEIIMYIMDHYPKPIMNSAMNLLSSHDRERMLTTLTGDKLPEHEMKNVRMKRNWIIQHHMLSQKQLLLGEKLVSLAVVLQYTLPGIPCIYYGDEIGMYGYADPDNRRPYPWGTCYIDFIGLHQKLAEIRRKNKFLKESNFHFISCTKTDLIFERRFQEECLVVIIHNSPDEKTNYLPKKYSQYEIIFQLGEYHKNKIGAYGALILKNKNT